VGWYLSGPHQVTFTLTIRRHCLCEIKLVLRKKSSLRLWTLCLCRHYKQGKQRASSSGRGCTGDNSECGYDLLHLRPSAASTSNNCFIQLCRRRADCQVTLVSEQVCQLGRRSSGAIRIIDQSYFSTSKRRINDVMSQCIQAYCTDVLNHVRIACILHHCNRSRRGLLT